jgi:hypothetical protein
MNVKKLAVMVFSLLLVVSIGVVAAAPKGPAPVPKGNVPVTQVLKQISELRKDIYWTTYPSFKELKQLMSDNGFVVETHGIPKDGIQVTSDLGRLQDQWQRPLDEFISRHDQILLNYFDKQYVRKGGSVPKSELDHYINGVQRYHLIRNQMRNHMVIQHQMLLDAAYRYREKDHTNNLQAIQKYNAEIDSIIMSAREEGNRIVGLANEHAFEYVGPK